MVATVPTRWAVTRGRGCRPPLRQVGLPPRPRAWVAPTLARDGGPCAEQGGGACASSRRSPACRGSRRRRSRARCSRARSSPGITSYDDPPPDVIDDLDAWRAEGRFRFANRLHAWAEIEHGRIVDAGCTGGGHDGRHHRAPGQAAGDVPAGRCSPTCAPTRRVGDTEVTFVQTTGGRTGLPAPRRVEAPAVPPVPRADGVDHARAHHPRRRHVELRGARREQVPAPLGVRRTTARSRPRSGSPTSRSGTATRSASTRRGATRTPRRSSPRSRPRSSGSCRSRSCRAASGPRSAP